MALQRVARDELTYPGKIKNYGTGYFIPIPKEYLDLLEIDLDGKVLFDVTVKIVSRPVEVQDPEEDEDERDRHRLITGTFFPTMLRGSWLFLRSTPFYRLV